MGLARGKHLFIACNSLDTEATTMQCRTRPRVLMLVSIALATRRPEGLQHAPSGLRFRCRATNLTWGCEVMHEAAVVLRPTDLDCADERGLSNEA